MFEKKKLKGTSNLWKGKFENLGQFLDWKENCRCPQHVLIKKWQSERVLLSDIVEDFFDNP